MKIHLKYKKGFTLIELLVVVAIISLLSSVVMASLNTARGKGRDAKRLGDLEQIRTALELYYNTNNAYPSTSGIGAYQGPYGWAGTCPYWGGLSTTGSGGYIPSLAPTYIPVLPTDPKSSTAPTDQPCYIYRSTGVDYMFLVYQSVEGTVPASLKASSYPNATYAIYTPGAAGW